ncbi:hypothetical protein RRF57_011422 [Xylaria bambusicola]|uniref:SprT-like domain-containing protein n=1 Tax=Xylaria bambusicola TaxID=326684 RepID=A0AAN7UMU4_9PEZI
MAARYPGSEQLKYPILQFMIIADKIFFFETLTRKVKTKQGQQPAVTLKVEDKTYSDIGGGDYGFEITDSHTAIIGFWEEYNLTLIVLLRGEIKGQGICRLPIESVLHTILHECIHAFIWFFADNDHPKHEERIGQKGEHGSIFREILRVIGERVEELTNSPGFKEVRDHCPWVETGRNPNTFRNPGGSPGFSPGFVPASHLTALKQALFLVHLLDSPLLAPFLLVHFPRVGIHQAEVLHSVFLQGPSHPREPFLLLAFPASRFPSWLFSTPQVI